MCKGHIVRLSLVGTKKLTRPGVYDRSSSIAVTHLWVLENKGDNVVKAQQCLNQMRAIVSRGLCQVISSPSLCSALCVGLLFFALGFVMLSPAPLPLSGLSALHLLSQSALHVFNKVPFGEPWP